MVQYDSAAAYLQSCTTLKAKIAAIDAIIDSLLVAAATGAAVANQSEYELNDGQAKIKMVYRSVADINKAIDGFEAMRQRYVNRLSSRVVRFVDRKNFGYGGR